MAEWIKGAVVRNTHWTQNLFSLQIDAPLQTFVAGQYTNLALDIEGVRSAQPYSILSCPGQHPLEFFFYTNLDGQLSAELAKLQSGDSIWIHDTPEGLFTLEQVAPAQDLWLLSTGTGVAPFLCMLLTDSIWEQFDHVVLVYAARTQKDLCYQELIAKVKAAKPQQFSFVPFISRESCEGSINGHIPTSIANGELEIFSQRKMQIENSQFMLCGNPGMVRDAAEVLRGRGFTDNGGNRTGQITYESYW